MMTLVIIDIAVPTDSSIRKKRLEKYQSLKEELERVWKVKTKGVLVVVGAFGAIV